MLATVHDLAHWRRVLAQARNLPGLEVDPADLPIHAGAVGFRVGRAEADGHDGRAVLDRAY